MVDENAFARAMATADIATVRRCLDEGCDPNWQHGTGVWTAAKKGHLALLKLLLEYGARDSFGCRAALHEAAKLGNQAMVDLLLAHGVEVDAMEADAWEYEHHHKTALCVAAGNGKLAVVDGLLSAGADVDGAGGNSPLHAAVCGGHAAVVRRLLEAGAQVGSASPTVPLYEAVSGGHIDICRLLISAGDGVDAEYGEPPLSKTAALGDREMALLLLQHGANTDGNRDYVPLAVAAAHGQPEMVELLLACGADVNAFGQSTGSALHGAAFAGDAELLEKLSALGADIEAGRPGDAAEAATAKCCRHDGYTDDGEEADEGEAALDSEWPLSRPIHSAIRGGSAAAVEWLLRNGAEPDATDANGETPLHLAARAGRTDLASDLLNRGADVNADGYWIASDGIRRGGGMTPLHLAAQEGHLDMVNFLLAHGAHVNSQHAATEVPEWDDDNPYEHITPLWAAAEEGHADVVQRLLAAGAQVAGGGDASPTALHAAARNGHGQVVQMLLDHESDPNGGDAPYSPLHEAAEHGHADIISVLLDSGADADMKGEDQGARYVTPLGVALRSGHVEAADVLLALGADPLLAEEQHASPLSLAAATGSSRLVAALLAAGCSPGASKDALHRAAGAGHVEAMEVLLQHGADPDGEAPYQATGPRLFEVRTYWRATPLHVAAGEGQLEALTLLLQVGADIKTAGDSGGTPLDLAETYGQKDVVQLLSSLLCPRHALTQAPCLSSEPVGSRWKYEQAVARIAGRGVGVLPIWYDDHDYNDQVQDIAVAVAASWWTRSKQGVDCVLGFTASQPDGIAVLGRSDPPDERARCAMLEDILKRLDGFVKRQAAEYSCIEMAFLDRDSLLAGELVGEFTPVFDPANPDEYPYDRLYGAVDEQEWGEDWVFCLRVAGDVVCTIAGTELEPIRYMRDPSAPLGVDVIPAKGKFTLERGEQSRGGETFNSAEGAVREALAIALAHRRAAHRNSDERPQP